MEIRNKILVFVALFGIISLFLLFTGSASAAVGFPADEAGISAYVKAKTSINLATVKPAFATIERETDDYIIGTVAMSGHSEEQYPHVYVSTDGWVVAYYPRDRSSGWLLPWYYYSGGPISTTTLKEVVQIVCDQIGGSTENLEYYDFRHPKAKKMMIVIESVGGTGSYTDFFKIRIPTDYKTYRVDWSHYSKDRLPYAYASQGNSGAKLDGVGFDYHGGGTMWSYGSFDPSSEFQNGLEHKIELSAYRKMTRIGLVLEYAE